MVSRSPYNDTQAAATALAMEEPPDGVPEANGVAPGFFSPLPIPGTRFDYAFLLRAQVIEAQIRDLKRRSGGARSTRLGQIITPEISYGRQNRLLLSRRQ